MDIERDVGQSQTFTGIPEMVAPQKQQRQHGVRLNEAYCREVEGCNALAGYLTTETDDIFEGIHVPAPVGQQEGGIGTIRQ